MDILKVKLVIVENVLNYKVEEQPDYLRSMYPFTASNGVKIAAHEYPELFDNNVVYLRGNNRNRDERVDSITMDNHSQAVSQAEKIQKAFYELEQAHTHLNLEELFGPLELEDLIDYIVFRNGRQVVFSILDQIKLPEWYTFKPEDKDKYFTIKAQGSPELQYDTIYLRGKFKDYDDKICIQTFPTEQEAIDYANKIIDSLSHWTVNFKQSRVFKVSVNTEIIPI